VGIIVATDCSSATGSSISLGELSPALTATATSQFATATNDPGGQTTAIYGTTMTSGNNLINGLGVPATSQVGSSQFGINLRANPVVSTGLDRTGPGSSNPRPEFNSPNLFTFKEGVVAASSLSTDFNRFTVTYIVNVSRNQSPGIYNSTLTFVAVAAF
jgi:hypothetical protein